MIKIERPSDEVMDTILHICGGAIAVAFTIVICTMILGMAYAAFLDMKGEQK